MPSHTHPTSDPRDYILDLSSAPTPSAATDSKPSSPSTLRTPFISIFFRCCKIYSPIYRNRDATAYAGHCPKCLRPAKIPIGPGGSSSRIFEAT